MDLVDNNEIVYPHPRATALKDAPTAMMWKYYLMRSTKATTVLHAYFPSFYVEISYQTQAICPKVYIYHVAPYHTALQDTLNRFFKTVWWTAIKLYKGRMWPTVCPLQPSCGYGMVTTVVESSSSCLICFNIFTLHYM